MIQVKKNKIWGVNSFYDPQKENRLPLISKQVQKQLNVDWMYLDNGKYNNDNWKYVFERMKKSKAKRLILQKNDRPSLIKELSNINFTSLNVLNLKSNKINSVQALSFINLPNLQWLYLDNNNIVSLRPLVKSKFTQLKKLHFNENRIKQVCASQFQLGKSFMSFQSEISSMNRISQEDLSFLVKMSCFTIRSISKSCQNIAFCGKKRIKQPQVYDAIQNRFNEIHFYDTHLEMIYNRPFFL